MTSSNPTLGEIIKHYESALAEHRNISSMASAVLMREREENDQNLVKLQRHMSLLMEENQRLLEEIRFQKAIKNPRPPEPRKKWWKFF